MRLYESVFIASDITSAQVEVLADDFAEIITSAGSSIKTRILGFKVLLTGSKGAERSLRDVQHGNWARICANMSA